MRPSRPRIPPPATGRRLALLLVPALLLGAALALPLADPAATTAQAASTRSVAWDRYDVAIDVRRDGSLRVVERQVVSFRGGPFSSGFADIPMDRVEAIRDLRVREESPRGPVAYERREGCCDDGWLPPRTYQYGEQNGFTAVRWAFDPAENERRTFVVEYAAVGALRVYGADASGEPPNQQLWWTAIAREATELAPVRASTVTVRLPQAIPPEAAVVGQGDDILPAAAHTTDGRTWTWQAAYLGPGEEFTVRLQFPPLVAAPPPAWQRADDDRRQREEAALARRAVVNTVVLGSGLLAIVGGGVGLYGFWRVRGRDPQVGPVADVLPEPPSDLPPGVAGALVDEVAHQRDIVATLVDLARRGIVAMAPADARPGADVAVTLRTATAQLSRFEQEVVRGLLGWNAAPGASVRLWDVSSRFAAAAPDIRRRLYAELVERGYFAASPEETREAWRDRALTPFLLLLVGGVAAGLLWASGVPFYWFALAGLGLLLVALYLASGALPRKTPAGAEAAARWHAFRRYLAGIERYERLAEAREIFDRYLPYAVAFGLEQRWVAAFARAGADLPAWYAPVLAGAASPTEDAAPTDRAWWRDDDHALGRAGDSWWDVTPGAETADTPQPSAADPDDGRLRFPTLGLPDWQGTSDHAGRALQGASNGLLSMLQTTGDALGSFAEATANHDDDGDSGSSWRSSSSRSSSRSSFGGGGRSGGSSGGGRRGFG